jgi:hypothetical protein
VLRARRVRRALGGKPKGGRPNGWGPSRRVPVVDWFLAFKGNGATLLEGFVNPGYCRRERPISITGDSPACVGAHQNAITIPIKMGSASAKPKSNIFALQLFSRRAVRMAFESKLYRNMPTPINSTPYVQTNWSRVGC